MHFNSLVPVSPGTLFNKGVKVTSLPCPYPAGPETPAHCIVQTYRNNKAYLTNLFSFANKVAVLTDLMSEASLHLRDMS